MVEVQRHLHWDADALWQRLLPLLPGLSVEVLARTDSTNTRLLERARGAALWAQAPVTRPGGLDSRLGALDGGGPETRPGSLEARPAADAPAHGRRAGDTEPCLLVAEHQTRGRGRMGRDWQATPGASLTFSLALPLAPADWSGLSLAVGLALAEALDPAGAPGGGGQPSILLKWPNDLWLRDAAAPGGGRKLGGVLVETVSVGGQREAVIGVGINVAPQSVGDPGTLAHGLAHLQELHPGLQPPQVLHALAEPLVREVLRFEREGFAPRAAAYAARDLLRGQAVSCTPPGPAQARALGVDADGALLLAVPLPGGGQAEQRLISGEVSVRPQAGAA